MLNTQGYYGTLQGQKVLIYVAREAISVQTYNENSRVVLTKTSEEEEDTTYINANYLEVEFENHIVFLRGRLSSSNLILL